MPTHSNSSSGDFQPPVRCQIRVAGVAQGVGFRPFVWRLAAKHQLSGWVRNDGEGVLLEIQGARGDAEAFVVELQASPPPQARIHDVCVRETAPLPESQGFTIETSPAAAAAAATGIAPDIAVCEDCQRELFAENNRRFGYPFINCCHCGPRFTIIEGVPYDRGATTMRHFQMCAECEREYQDPGNRRFHAQPNACPRCGPRIWLVDDPEEISDTAPEATPSPASATVQRFAFSIQQGAIVAVKGIGGFHLACDAAHADAIATLRRRKGRVAKPLAVLASGVEQVTEFAVVTQAERELLQSWMRPIVLLRKRIDGPPWLADVAPNNDFVGVLLPYSPLHALLAQSASPLVLTSGNLSEEPIVRTNAEARERLARLADQFLLHDRQISAVCDDSVVRCTSSGPILIRRSRGYAPAPIYLPSPGPSVLAVGGQRKGAFCVTQRDAAYLSQHLGDMENLETLLSLQANVDRFLGLLGLAPAAVAADTHPDYVSARWAETFAAQRGIPLLRIQHHHAHAAALLGEHDESGTMLACVFDGTGWGEDGSVWGGEVLLVDRKSFQRLAHLRPFALPSGDASIERPWHSALSVVNAEDRDWLREQLAELRVGEFELVRQQVDNPRCLQTSSMGRLFDAVAALIGLRTQVTYEGQAAMELESLAGGRTGDVSPTAYRFALGGGDPLEIDWRPLVRSICRDILNGVEPAVIGLQFHHAVAHMIRDACSALGKRTRVRTVGLTGGVFQNALLLRLAVQQLKIAGFRVLVHQSIPPNDGGLAFGQAIIARERFK